MAIFLSYPCFKLGYHRVEQKVRNVTNIYIINSFLLALAFTFCLIPFEDSVGIKLCTFIVMRIASSPLTFVQFETPGIFSTLLLLPLQKRHHLSLQPTQLAI